MLGQPVSALMIGAMVLLGVALDATLSHRSRHAVRRLRARIAETATVVRDGRPLEVPVTEVVPGDLVRLAAGDLVPADARLVAAKDLFLAEAALTGESLPVEKRAGAGGEAGRDAAWASALFRGTSVVSGLGEAVVVRTGRATELGQVAARLAARPAETEFERGTRQLGVLVLEIVAFLVLFVFLANAMTRREPLEALLFALALAVGLTPELLPLIVSVTLASGAVRLAARRVVVRRLAAIESLGGMDVLCSDKTGTLTAGAIDVQRHVNLRGEEDETVIRLAALNSVFQTGLRSPMDEAILRHPHPATETAVRVDEIPFDFIRRRVSVVVDDEGVRRLVTKGAPEGILPLCTAAQVRGATRPLDAPTRAAAEALFERLSEEGFRVLAVASRPVERRDDAYGVRDERDLVLAGFAGFLDPPLDGVGETISALARDGVAVKILTGDNERVTRRICEQVGLALGEIVLGDEVDAMSDSALGVVAERAPVFARLSPSQKNRIVQALRARGHVVGFLGDGINDGPALLSADVGISVEGAVDVAREAADVVLLEKRLAVLHDGVLEGRRSFGNIVKYVLMGTSSNFGNVLSVAVVSLVLPFLPMLPVQILLNNLLYDLSQVAIPADRVEEVDLVKPRRWDVAFIRRYLLVLGPVSSAFDLALFALMLRVFHVDQTLFRTAWFVESLATQTLVVFVIRTSGPPWASRPAPALAWAVGLVVAVGLAIPMSPLAPWLGFRPLPGPLLAVLGVMVVLYLGLAEVVKRRVYRRP